MDQCLRRRCLACRRTVRRPHLLASLLKFQLDLMARAPMTIRLAPSDEMTHAFVRGLLRSSCDMACSKLVISLLQCAVANLARPSVVLLPMSTMLKSHVLLRAWCAVLGCMVQTAALAPSGFWSAAMPVESRALFRAVDSGSIA